MKLIGNLKKQVENEGSKEGRKKLIEKAGMLLTDDELDRVAGGIFTMEIICLALMIQIVNMPSRKDVRLAPNVPIETGKARAPEYGASVSDRLFMYGSDDGREVIMPSVD